MNSEETRLAANFLNLMNMFRKNNENAEALRPETRNESTLVLFVFNILLEGLGNAIKVRKTNQEI